MNDLGQYALFLAWFGSLYVLLSLLRASRYGGQAAASLLKAITISVAVLTTSSLIILGYLFLTNYYSNQYVWQYSNKSMDWIYKITAIWGGMDGSMLLWAGLLSVMAAFAVIPKFENKTFTAWLCFFLNSASFFFLTIVLFFTNPFRYIQAGFIPPDGNGLNPLLQNPYMAIHPPLLYLGFTGFAVPYAFAMAALTSKNLNNWWIQASRKWTLIAWGFLTAGITLGGHWAYLELGWGGFWAWDPVENSSFLPWLVGTAYLHSVMVQEKRGLLKVWNIILITATYALTVFGTFLTRSGVVQSVHAFASTDIGWIFLVYLSILVLTAIGLIFLRKKDLQPEQKLESFFSRETIFLLNNLLFTSICFATFWGVMFPVFSEALTGHKQAVGIPYFNKINTPLFLLLLFFAAVGPLVSWRKTNLSQLKKTLLPALILSFILGLVLIWIGVGSIQTIISYSLISLIILTVLGEYHRGTSKQTGKSYPVKMLSYWAAHRRRAAGFLVHFGVAIAALGITASMAGKIEKEFSLPVGQVYQVGEYSLELNELKEVETENYFALRARVTAYKNQHNFYTTLEPELRRYTRNQESTTEVALKMGLKNDLYLVLAGLNETGNRASFKVYINPLQIWLWFGVIIMIIGTLITIKNNEG